ncbi:MAG: PfkB family carbohydrate kinase [Ignavibacteriaceae bacterium]
MDDGIVIDESRPTTTKTRVIADNQHVVRIDKESKDYIKEVFKPNRKEAEAKLGAKIFTAEEISIAGKKLMEQLKAKYLLLTLGEEGIAIFENGKPVERMETKARKVADVSGAGDTVISTLTIAMAAGADIMEACYLANYAGGLVCEEVGIVPIEQKKLFETVLKEHR